MLEKGSIDCIVRPRINAYAFLQMSADPRQPKAHEDFDRNKEEEQAVQAATEDAKRLGLNSFKELLDTRPQSVDKVLKLIQSVDPASRDITPDVIGVISTSVRAHWLFFHPADDLYEGADAIEITLADPRSSATDPESIEIHHDIWCIIQKQPLLLCSMYGAILGFKNSADGVDCVALYEGHDGWT